MRPHVGHERQVIDIMDILCSLIYQTYQQALDQYPTSFFEPDLSVGRHSQLVLLVERVSVFDVKCQ